MNDTDLDLEPAKLNIDRMTVEQLRKLPMTSTNSTAITRLILAKQPKIEIKIPSTDKDKKPFYIAINGHNFHIPRDKWWAVPEDVVKHMENMVQTVYLTSEKKDADGRMVTESQTIQRVGYQTRPIHTEPAPELKATRK